MTQPAKSQEPSMEEILASIRRIIADDDANKSPPPRSAGAAESTTGAGTAAGARIFRAAGSAAASGRRTRVASDDGGTEPARRHEYGRSASDILDLDRVNGGADAAAFAERIPWASAMPNPAPQFRTIDGSSDVGFDEASERPAGSRPSEERGRLISSATSAAVNSAFNALAQTVLVQNARTLEDLVREMLRPMLKTWLDDNLPGMVERLVRAEIERVSRGRDQLSARYQLSARRQAGAPGRTAPPDLP